MWPLVVDTAAKDTQADEAGPWLQLLWARWCAGQPLGAAGCGACGQVQLARCWALQASDVGWRGPASAVADTLLCCPPRPPAQRGRAGATLEAPQGKARVV